MNQADRKEYIQLRVNALRESCNKVMGGQSNVIITVIGDSKLKEKLDVPDTISIAEVTSCRKLDLIYGLSKTIWDLLEDRELIKILCEGLNTLVEQEALEKR